jgi:hypothetical protein
MIRIRILKKILAIRKVISLGKMKRQTARILDDNIKKKPPIIHNPAEINVFMKDTGSF